MLYFPEYFEIHSKYSRKFYGIITLLNFHSFYLKLKYKRLNDISLAYSAIYSEIIRRLSGATPALYPITFSTEKTVSGKISAD